MKCLSLGMYMIDHYYVIAYFKTRQGGRKDFEFVHNMSKFSSQEVESNYVVFRDTEVQALMCTSPTLSMHTLPNS